MTFIRVENVSDHAEVVPARGRMSVVLKPGEKATVCPEGVEGQDRFHDMVSNGSIAERGRKRSRVLQFIPYHSGRSGGGSDRAA